MKCRYKVASLFSGCGGLDLGFVGGFDFMGRHYDEHPTDVVFACDIDSDAVNCYNSNGLLHKNSDAPCLLGDVRKVKSEDIPDYDILLAGFPCQPFSNAGNRKGVNDANGRGTLFEECERFLKTKIESGKRPKAFLFENVRGILSSKMESGITVPDEIKNRMEKLGYNVSMQLVCASNYGVPQMRYRVLIIGIDKNIGAFSFDSLTEIVNEYGLPSLSKGNHVPLMLGSVLQNLQDLPDNESWPYTPATQRMVELIGPCEHGAQAFGYFKPDTKVEDLPGIVFEGRSWKNMKPDDLTPRFRKIYDDPKKYHSPKFYRRFAFGEINGTVIASAQPENSGITHPVENRRYTVREIARIQSFPDDFTFGAIPLESRYKVIGNAVPPIMAWVVAGAIIKTLER